MSCSQGRGEFVRLALEEAGADYVNVARGAGGERAMLRLLDGEEVEHPPLAPPYLGQAADRPDPPTSSSISGPRHDLAPTAGAGRLWAHQPAAPIS